MKSPVRLASSTEKILRLAARVLAAAAACASLQPLAAQTPQSTWTLASGYPKELFHGVNLRQFAQNVNDRTKGGLVIEVHTDGIAASPSEIVGKVRSGDLAAGEVLLSSMASDTRIAGADAIPFIVHSYDDALRLWNAQRPILQETLDKQGLVILYAVPWPAQGLFTTRPVRSVADLRGSKMRTYNPSTVRLAQLMGATPVDVPTQAIGSAFKDQRLDTMFTSPATGVDSKLWEGPAKYFYNARGWYPKNIVIANKAKWAALPESTRQTVMAAAGEAQKRGWMASEAASTVSLAELASKGIKVNTPEPELRNELRRIGEKFSVEYLRETGAEGNRMLIPYFANGSTTTPK
ncbi:TRAP transporter substrate-binding protein [Paracidovorax valerianellae]|uniref:TRAP-type C4-dicarboxylate transport system, substrate-binding protein n=1 Tax=Paracidovorax valerianellae TaxID=187868 RepID=A0A1G7F7B1_9BURK|nr:TRAP transporter substrate-binding protein [Paracidovorax valerianellae]MDA8443644.1 TRAP transporter substrate-binding protein [Paracidovorax valerianellae]SDE71759.1 TRAP-type C4-dicarboxylate transport system, substrate-binding protein [Paracidovorax valerianellae]